MRVLHVIPSLSLTSGGPSLALPAMAKALHNAGITVDVTTTDDDGRGLHKRDIPLGEPVKCDGYRAFYFKKQTEFYKVSIPLHSWLVKHVSYYDLVHVHALFSFTSIAAMRAARRMNVPCIVRPLGLLNTYGMQKRRRLIKHWSFRLIEKPLLDAAAAIHYTSNQERDEAAPLGIKAPAQVIPLGFDLTAFKQLPDAEIFHERFPETRGKQIILFLSRLDPKKGLDFLLPAFAELHSKNKSTHLVIAGTGTAPYMNELKKLADHLAIADHVTWAGQLDGALKLAAFAAATVFVLPSHSENFGIALLEAMAAGVACVASDQVALANDVATDAAVSVVKQDVNTIADTMGRLLDAATARAAMASRAKQIAYERYSLPALGSSLNTLYNTLALD